jgi:Tfp pilus assembly protein PilN
MKAVNLIPTDERRDVRGAPTKSGGLVYVLIGALGVGLLMMVALTLVNKSLNDSRAELSSVKAKADAAQAEATAMAPYTQFAALRAKRVETVRSLAASRFDWAHAMHEVARVIPGDVWLQSLKGLVTSKDGGGSLRGAIDAPAMEITGCTTSQKGVVRMMSRMRQIDGVQRVSLDSSAKQGGGGSAAAGASAGAPVAAGCSGDKDPTFSLIVFFKAPVTPAGAAAATAPATTTAPSTTGGTP